MSTTHPRDNESIESETQPWQHPLRLQELYWDDGLSMAKIAAKFGVSKSTIRYWMEKHDIDRRGPDTATVPYARVEVNNYGHVVWHQSGGANQDRECIPVHRLLAVADHGVDAVAGMDVHHKNGVPWDNRIENLELLSREEHSAQHGREKVSKEELLLDLRAGASVLGCAPGVLDVRDFGAHSPATYYRFFDSWEAALEAANIDPETGELHGGVGDVLQ